MRLPEGRIVHRSPGRLRIRIGAQTGQTDFFDYVRQRLLEHPRIRQVDVNARTGSILITGSIPEIEPFSEFSRENALFRLDPGATVRHEIHRSFSRSNETVLRSTRGALDLPILIFFLLVGSGIVQILRSGFQLPPWHTAFWYALGVFTLSKIDFESGVDHRTGEPPARGDS